MVTMYKCLHLWQQFCQIFQLAIESMAFKTAVACGHFNIIDIFLHEWLFTFSLWPKHFSNTDYLLLPKANSIELIKLKETSTCKTLLYFIIPFIKAIIKSFTHIVTQQAQIILPSVLAYVKSKQNVNNLWQD